MNIACITVSRKESIFLKMWVAHHGAMFGHKNLFVNIHGRDGLPKELPLGVNLIVHERSKNADRAEKNKWGYTTQSQLAGHLLSLGYEWVIRLDIDEFLVVDPEDPRSFADIVASYGGQKILHATGIDVLHRLGFEEEMEPGDMVLERHQYGVISRAYSKPCMVSTPPNWRAGAHRVVDSKNHVVCPEIFLFHLALSDMGLFRKRIGETYGDAGRAQKQLLKTRKNTLCDSSSVEPMVFEQAQKQALEAMAPQNAEFLKEDRTRFITDPNFSDGYYTKIPERFANQIQYLDA